MITEQRDSEHSEQDPNLYFVLFQISDGCCVAQVLYTMEPLADLTVHQTTPCKRLNNNQ